ncbi:superoxide dismutase family protein [Litoribaculum gwangyangense]|uniref:Superoxide dismutase copper/zinc binding domain-containing protein n=1 Tax=Litoribaculum gwangyangense TaxID=1130722 RepID=A0ABP9CSJ0_9FLAO
MKKISVLILALAISAIACKQNKKEDTIEDIEVTETVVQEMVTPKTLTIALSAKSDSNVSGKVVFTEENGTVNMMATVSGIEPGEHAIHLHETADCSANDGSSTGGHWNPTNQPHGAWGAESGYHKGDIGNFTADENGNATVEFSTDLWCIGCDDDTKNIVGKGVIIHAGVDDLTSQPSGAAGARVSCAGIIE